MSLRQKVHVTGGPRSPKAGIRHAVVQRVLDFTWSCAVALTLGAPVRPASLPGVCKREMPHWRKAFALLLACPLLTAAAAAAEPVHGIAMHGAPKYPSGFAHFSYVNPSAPKGGRLVLGTLGTFDSLNPFIIKGVTPGNLRDYVYESLMARGSDEPFTLYGLIAESVEGPEDRSSFTFHFRQ